MNIENFDESENFLKQLYELSPSDAYNLEIKLIKKKLAKQFENQEYETIISSIDEKLKKLDKIKEMNFILIWNILNRMFKLKICVKFMKKEKLMII